MKLFITILASFASIFLMAQNAVIEGELLVIQSNKIATFQSNSENSFIQLTNNGVDTGGTSIGYHEASDTNYFFINAPGGDFNDFRIDHRGRVVIGKPTNLAAQLSVYSTSENFFQAGLYAKSESPSGFGVYARAYGTGSSGVVGFGEGCDFKAGGGGGMDYCSSSSRRWKSNIKNLSNPLDLLAGLRGVSFDWNAEHGGQRDIGFIAEEVGEVLPEIVMYEANQIDAVGLDYSRMTPLLVEAANAMRAEYQGQLSEQQSEIDQLRTEMNALKELIQAITMDTELPSAK